MQAQGRPGPVERGKEGGLDSLAYSEQSKFKREDRGTRCDVHYIFTFFSCFVHPWQAIFEGILFPRKNHI